MLHRGRRDAPVRTTRRSAIAGVFIALFVSISLFAAGGLATADTHDLERAIERVLADSLLRKVTVAVHVEELDGGAALFSRNADLPLTPGSNMKLLTTAAVLDQLGVEYQFRTEVLSDAPIRKGELDGDLILVGGGDPTLSDLFHDGDALFAFDDLASQLRARGMRTVAGDLVVDARFFDDQLHHPSWPQNQLHLRYCAPISAIAVNDNCVEFEVKPGAVGGRARIKATPLPASIPLVNEVRTVSASRRASASIDVQWRTSPTRFHVRGEITRNTPVARVEAPVQDPVRAAAELFREALARAGVRVSGEVVVLDDDSASGSIRLVSSGDTPGGHPAASHPLATEYPDERYRSLALHSSSLVDAIQVTNEESQNFYAEQLLKTLGRHVYGDGSFASGGRAVADTLRRIGLVMDGFHIADGSGLSRDNKISARGLVRVLRHMLSSTEPRVARAFFTSLPVSGVRGSLLKRLDGEDYAGRVAAKTGYVSRASALSGYAETSSGTTRVFSIIMNGFKPPTSNRSMKKLQDRIVQAIVDHP